MFDKYRFKLSFRIVFIVLGIFVLVPGITALIDYFKENNSSSLVLGIITILISLILIIKTDLVASILPFILGIYFIFPYIIVNFYYI